MAIREGVVDSPLVLEHHFVWTSPHDSFHVGWDCSRWVKQKDVDTRIDHLCVQGREWKYACDRLQNRRDQNLGYDRVPPAMAVRYVSDLEKLLVAAALTDDGMWSMILPVLDPVHNRQITTVMMRAIHMAEKMIGDAVANEDAFFVVSFVKRMFSPNGCLYYTTIRQRH